MPFAIGLSTVLVLRFVFLNALGAIVWASVVVSGGYLFGNALEGLLGDIRKYETTLFLLVAIAGIVTWAHHLNRRKLKKPKGREIT